MYTFTDDARPFDRKDVKLQFRNNCALLQIDSAQVRNFPFSGDILHDFRIREYQNNQFRTNLGYNCVFPLIIHDLPLFSGLWIVEITITRPKINRVASTVSLETSERYFFQIGFRSIIPDDGRSRQQIQLDRILPSLKSSSLELLSLRRNQV